MDIGEIRGRLREVRSAHSGAVQRASKFVRSVLVAGGALAAGIAQFCTWPLGGKPDAAQLVGIIATGIVFIGGLFILLTEQDAATAIKTADEALAKAEDLAAEAATIEAFFDANDRLSATFQAALSLRSAFEQALNPTPADVDMLITTAFDTVKRQLAVAAGFRQSDRWIIGVYRSELDTVTGRDQLRCLVHDRAIPCQVGQARSWPEGVGIAGIAYTNRREVVIPDLRAEGMQAIFGPQGFSNPFDADRYISMVSVPILVAGRSKPWGVVNATNDQADHFSADGRAGFKNDEPIRMLAAFCALAVAMYDAVDKARGASSSPPAPVSSGSTP